MTKPDPKWIGLDESLLTSDLTEPYLEVSLLDARLLEEIAHIWDYRLEAAKSPYSSAGAEWDKVAGSPFDIPNRKDYDRMAEDWASAVVWYSFKPNELRRISMTHYLFVERLFSRKEI